MLERALQKGVIKLCCSHGAFVRKIESPNNAGMPDLLIVHQGRTLFLELKTETGRLSPLQIQTHKELEAAGATVRTSFGFDDAEAILYECFGWRK